MLFNVVTFTFYSVLCVQSVRSLLIGGRSNPTPTPYHDWDYLLYSQRWPITACSQWEEAGKDHTCSMPTDKSLWSVHGIWPTKIGTEGPLFCPSAIHFDPQQLTPIMDDLKARWINIEANTKPLSFWKHEWKKHGTCASILPQLDSVTNYFKLGLDWNKQYKLSDMLRQSKIIPGPNGYSPQQLSDAVRAVTKTNPTIQCVVDRHTKESMVSEIRICFDKMLQPVDCDLLTPNHPKQNGTLTNCSWKKPVMYYAEVPSTDATFEPDYICEGCRQYFEEQMYYVGLYKFLKFLIWFTT